MANSAVPAKIGNVVRSGARLAELRERILREAIWCAFDHNHIERTGLSYQTCRFCKGGDYGSKGGGLYKYGVRHYICPPCVSDADPTLPARLGRRPFLPEASHAH